MGLAELALNLGPLRGHLLRRVGAVGDQLIAQGVGERRSPLRVAVGDHNLDQIRLRVDLCPEQPINQLPGERELQLLCGGALDHLAAKQHLVETR